MKNLAYEFILRRMSTILSIGILTLTAISAITGVLLSFYYEPAAGRAYQSLKWIDSEVYNGLLIHSVHNLAGNAVIAIALIQIVVMFLGRQFRGRWLTAWISGILFTLSAIGLGWTAMILSWDQLGYWRFRIELQTIEAIPFIGHELRNILTGGGAINTETVQHLYTLHSYVVSIGAIILAVVHLWGILRQEKEMQGSLAAMPEAAELQGQPGQTEGELVQTP